MNKKLIEYIEKHPKSVFWTRFVMWAIFACVLPFSYIAYRFELFSKVSKISVSGWGIFAILIVAIFVIGILKYVRMAFKGNYTFTGQCISGICKIIIPLVALYAVLTSIQNNLDIFLKSLGCVILCELVAIPLNPMPEWASEKQKDLKEEERKNAIDYLLDSFFSKKKENK